MEKNDDVSMVFNSRLILWFLFWFYCERWRMIDIKDMIPFMQKGWVAMDEDGCWYWYDTKPKCSKKLKEWTIGHSNSEFMECFFPMFRIIKPADDWTKSLMEIRGENGN